MPHRRCTEGARGLCIEMVLCDIDPSNMGTGNGHVHRRSARHHSTADGP